ncbi:GNAT family N-acetyltransferase [Arenibaculum pallidiluteum]|uniref:GNAT family N-acetyltransferase n=1 Tax=Arenibaculum pallidiluteum TaxID=2812559 RepID=UPI001A96BAFB|nr:GNAT family N-acetyltransferase [Arenibaculum pallidiluteum]
MTRSDIAIREIATSDGPALRALWRETWTATYGPSLGTEALAAMLGQLDAADPATMLPAADERGLCALLGGGIVGSVIFAERNRTACLWGLYVQPSRQRRGIGTLLLEAAAARLETSDRMEVRVLESSSGAVAFYRKHGFSISHQETDAAAIPATATVMTRALGPRH